MEEMLADMTTSFSEMLFELEAPPVVRKRMGELYRAVPVGFDEL
jgi:hypothetical protein